MENRFKVLARRREKGLKIVLEGIREMTTDKCWEWEKNTIYTSVHTHLYLNVVLEPCFSSLYRVRFTPAFPLQLTFILTVKIVGEPR